MGLGSLLLGTVADRLGRRPLTLACLLIMSLGMILASTTLARYFPTQVRATGTGFGIGIGIGVGRGGGGAALGPALAGFLFASNMGLQSVAIVMACCGSFLAALTLLLLRTARDATD